MYKLHQTISMTSLKSKSLFQSFLLTKFPKSIKLLTRQNRKENLNSTWPLKNHQENRLSSLWVSTILKEVKLEVSTNFIYLDNKDLLLTSNKVVASFDLNVIDKYSKELNNVDSNKVISPRLLQSKSYLKFLGVSYFIEDTNTFISSNIIKYVIKSTYIFNDIILTSWSHIIKVSPKSDMVVIWVNIWDFQSGLNVKILINKCFNIKNYITMIYKTNMNPRAP